MRTCHPDLIILDVSMPDMTGYEVLKKLKSDKKTSEIPVIMLTSHSLEKDVQEIFRLGAQDYVGKPFSTAHLLSRVKTWLLRSGFYENSLP